MESLWKLLEITVALLNMRGEIGALVFLTIRQVVLMHTKAGELCLVYLNSSSIWHVVGTRYIFCG